VDWGEAISRSGYVKKVGKGNYMTMLTKVQIWSSFLLIILVAGMLCACRSPAPEVANEGELLTYHLEIDLLGAKHEASVDSQGRLKTNVELSSADGAISLSIDADTILLDKDGEPLQLIQAAIDPTLPLPPEDAYIVGAVYDLTPHGANFNPSIMLTLSYDPDQLPQGMGESDVYIACYEDSQWDMVRYKQVDTENHRVATRIDHFAKYAVLAPKPSPKPPPKPDLTSMSLEQALSSGKPTLADFGCATCAPCIAMKPVLEELAVEYKDKLNVVIADVFEHRDLANQYGIMLIPTQIFFDSSGNEVTRHIGPWPKEEIIAQLQKMEID